MLYSIMVSDCSIMECSSGIAIHFSNHPISRHYLVSTASSSTVFAITTIAIVMAGFGFAFAFK